MSRPGRLRRGAVAEMLIEVEAEFVRLLTALEGLARDLVQLVGGTVPAGDLSRDQLASLRHSIAGVLDDPHAFATGAGVIATPGAFLDAPYWLDWWWNTPGGNREALRVNLDPRAPDFFDYPSAPWFAETVRTGRRRVTGPFVDYECTNAYSLTVSTPASLEHGVAGIAGADVLVSRLERLVLPALVQADGPLLLTNHDRRTIASNTADWAPGLLAPADAPRERAVPGPDPTSPLRSWYLVDVSEPVS